MCLLSFFVNELETEIKNTLDVETFADRNFRGCENPRNLYSSRTLTFADLTIICEIPESFCP